MLAEIMRLHQGIAVAGSHGKTTTTSMIGHLLARGGFDPTVVVGGRLRMIGGGARLGRGRYLVAEADESDGSFLDLNPTIAVVTNIDREHLDHYRDLPQIQRAFLKFTRHVPFYGLAIVCGDDPNVRTLLPRIRKRVLTYGFAGDNHLQARDLSPQGLRQEFMVEWRGARLGRLHLAAPGRHNALNALAAVAVGLELGLSAAECLKGLEDFQGVGRRFEVREEREGITLIDDYGHHPTEIAAVLATARTAFPGRLVVVFQPHRYSRTRALTREFAEVLKDADVLVLADIYAAGERSIPGVSSDGIQDALRLLVNREIVRVKGQKDAPGIVASLLRRGDTVLTLGAGDVSRWGDLILEEWLRRAGTAEGPEASEDASPAPPASRARRGRSPEEVPRG